MKTPDKQSFNKWLETDEGHQCLKMPVTERKYLENRLWWAYNAGENSATSQIEDLTKEVERLKKVNENSIQSYEKICTKYRLENDRYREALEAIERLASTAPPFRKDLILANSKIYNTTSSALHPLVKEGETKK